VLDIRSREYDGAIRPEEKFRTIRRQTRAPERQSSGLTERSGDRASAEQQGQNPEQPSDRAIRYLVTLPVPLLRVPITVLPGQSEAATLHSCSRAMLILTSWITGSEWVRGGGASTPFPGHRWHPPGLQGSASQTANPCAPAYGEAS